MDSKKHILIIAGGTGGHVFPGLAVAQQLLKQGHKVTWLGSAGRLEEKIIPQYHIPLILVSSYRLRGENFFAKLLLPFKLLFSIIKIIFILRKIKPNVVLAMGGYVTVPGGLAAWIMRIPLLIHEQNKIMGLSNKLLSKFARYTLVAFPHTVGAYSKAVVVGNPVRENIVRTTINKQSHESLNLLILGGSLGALTLNRLLPNSLQHPALQQQCIVWHQTGKQHLIETQQAYQHNNIKAQVEAFIEDMAAAYQWADLVICRAGALTLAEIQVSAVPAIFVPYPYAADNHQYHNANYLVEQQAAMVLSEDDISAEKIRKILLAFLAQPQRLSSMRQQLFKLKNNDATSSIVKYCMEVRC